MVRKPCLLLTGGNGFVGKHMMPALQARLPDHRLVLLLKEKTDDVAALPGWSLESADITDDRAVEEVVERLKPEIVIHLAAQSSVAHALDAAETTWRVNFCGTLALASAVARHTAGGTFLFASTGEVYGCNLQNGPAVETTPLAPLNSYAASKVAAEQMLSDVLPPTARLIITRAFNHSGRGQDERFVLPSFAAQIARIETGRVSARMMVGNLEAERDFLHVADVVDAYVRLIGIANRLEHRTIVNVASGRGWKIAALLTMMRGMARMPFEIESDPERMRPSEIPVAVGDNSKLKKLTGWEPRREINGMLSEILDEARTTNGQSASLT